MGSYTRRTHTMGLPKAIQKEAWSERTYRNRAGAWCPDRRGNLNHPCRLEHRTAHQRSWPPRAEVRNALGTRGSARGGEQVARNSREDKNEGAMDRAKGRMKEAGGAITGDKSKKREGRSDQRKGRAKEKKGDLKDLLS